jgi:diguanylate cyclase (GGDEF)-like protein
MLQKSGVLVGMQSQIDDLTETNKDLEQLLVVDEKTGLYNFRHFQRQLRDEWQRASRYDTPLSLVFLDIDNLKPINDTHGHPAGDRALQEFATLVAGGARSTDTAARYGGDEFAMILPHTDGPMARRVAERIRLAVEQFVFLEDKHAVQVTVSIGVATYPASGVVSMDALIRAADSALYLAKEQGRNRVVTRGGDSVGNEGGVGPDARSADDRPVRAERS